MLKNHGGTYDDKVNASKDMARHYMSCEEGVICDWPASPPTLADEQSAREAKTPRRAVLKIRPSVTYLGGAARGIPAPMSCVAFGRDRKYPALAWGGDHSGYLFQGKSLLLCLSGMSRWSH